MKLLRWFSILFLTFTTGCVATHKYQGNNFPQLTSEKYPAYAINSPIVEGVEIKLPVGNGKTKMSMDLAVSKGSNSVTVDNDTEWDWNIKYKNKKIVSEHTMNIYTHVQGKDTHLKMNINGIHDTNGKEINMDVNFSDKDREITVAELDEFRQEMSAYINQQFTSIGKKIKTGSIYKEIPNKLSKFKTISQADKNKSTIPEIVKGWGSYKNKKVIVTEYIFEDRVDSRSGSITEMRGKGYNLYDGESFIQVSGEATFYANIFTPKEGTTTMNFDIRLNTDVYHIDIIDTSKL